MRALALLACLSTGCATTWIITQATGEQKAWDESSHDVHVPQPGVTEKLTVRLPLAVEHEEISTDVPGQATPRITQGPAKPFALACHADQHAKDRVYHTAFRYGHHWRLETGLAFLVEGAVATALVLAAKPDKNPGSYLLGWYLAADAVVTAPLIFFPRKEIYREEDLYLTTALRDDCPEGLALDIGGEVYPVDAAGGLGALGTQALTEWMANPRGELRARLGERAQVIPVDDLELCAWRREHAPAPQPGEPPPTDLPCNPRGQVLPRDTSAVIEVPAGTLTTVAAGSGAPASERP